MIEIITFGGISKTRIYSVRSYVVEGSAVPPRNSRDASGPALLFIQAEIGAVVRGVKAGEFDYPT